MTVNMSLILGLLVGMLLAMGIAGLVFNLRSDKPGAADRAYSSVIALVAGLALLATIIWVALK